MKLLPLLLVLSGVAVGAVDKDTGCLDGIRTAVSDLLFNGTDPTDYYGTLCTNKLVVTSLWASAKVYCTPRQIQAGFKLLDGYCVEYGNVKLTPYSEVLPVLTNSFIKSLPVAQYSDIEDATVFNTSVLISRPLYKAAKDTVVTFDLEYVLHQRYGWANYGFWGGLLLIGIINKLVSHYTQSRRLLFASDVEASNPAASSRKPHSYLGAMVSPIHHWLRSNVIIPAAFGSSHSRPFLWCTIPTRMETIVVVSFWIMNLILSCVSYYIFSPNLYYTEYQQALRYIADRTGILCFSNLPWLWMFSGRNNIFIFLTGWSFSTFNIFHRHIARCATVLAIVHGVCWSVLEANFGYYAEEWKEQYWYMGAMGLVSMSFLVLFSFMWFRVRSYEVFLLIHISLSIITIIALFYHVKIFDGEYNGYLWPLVAIWSFDRAARLFRQVYCNLHVRLSGSVVGTKASATYVKDGDFVRLEIQPGSQIFKPGPGQHYFLYQPLKWKGWENHPFTLGHYETKKDLDSEASSSTGFERDIDATAAMHKEIQVITKKQSPNASSDVSPDPSHYNVAISEPVDSQQKLTFFVRPFSSWTKRLRDECLKSPDGMIRPHLFIEGPYGERSLLHTYENVIFIVGGTGIAGALPYLQEHLRMKRTNAGNNGSPATITRDITLIWSAKQRAMIRNIAAREMRPILRCGDIHAHFHATSCNEVYRKLEASTSDVPTVDGDPKMTMAEPSVDDGLVITCGRPDIRQSILDILDDVNGAGSAGGKIAILTCGPTGMANEARAAVHKALKQGKRGVDYIEETFGW